MSKTKDKWQYTVRIGWLSEEEIQDLHDRYEEIDVEAYSQFGYCFPDLPSKDSCWLYWGPLGEEAITEAGKINVSPRQKELADWLGETIPETEQVNFSLRQKELADWQVKNFGGSTSEKMALGMAEEVGELAHWLLKRSQGIREAVDGGDLKAEIADAFADTLVFGIQLMTIEGIDAEEAFNKTVETVLARNWKDNPEGKGESQHNKAGS